MQLQFKVQPYQSAAVAAVVDCFAGQPLIGAVRYRQPPRPARQADALQAGFGNAEIQLPQAQLLANVRAVQQRQNLTPTRTLDAFTQVDGRGGVKPKPAAYRPGARLNLDIEMETGTGKTYCYIKTIFELNKRYGWGKFIVMTPSIAIREGVYQSFQLTATHFTQAYGKRARFFIYHSKRLHELESFSSDAGINVMIINIQAFNARGADNRRIYDQLDDFQSRRPIDVISGNRPILILDEPQKMEGRATLDALPKFRPLLILRYSATHRTNHLKVHRLDALDAYHQRLVKKIAVRGISVRGLPGTNAYLYLEGIDISRQAPVARLELEVKLKSGEIKRRLRRLKFKDDLFAESNQLDQYRGFTISQIDANENTVEFTNGVVLRAGEAGGDVHEKDVRRIQIREAIKAHLDKERQLFAQGIKALSLFFIDQVVKYRDYERADEKGEYARIFEEEYALLRDEYLDVAALDAGYRDHLAAIDAVQTHKGYFAIDKKGRMQDPKAAVRGEQAGLSDDVSAYELILKDKERLLAFSEPTRFIFSHSALREGWDNPNVFVMCMLKHSDNTISRRQEVGRGLRLAVDQQGRRIDQPAIVHEVNVLTVVASESYEGFVAGLQSEIVESLSARPRKANVEYFAGKIMKTASGAVEVDEKMARQIYRYLVRHDYTDEDDGITDKYHAGKEAAALADLTAEMKPYTEQIFYLIDSVFDDSKLPQIGDDRRRHRNPLNDNFRKKEFQELWQRINRKAVYRVDFESAELIDKAVKALDGLQVRPLQYTVRAGEQLAEVTDAQLNAGTGFALTATHTEKGGAVHSAVRYDVIGKVAADTELTRKTIAAILGRMAPASFDQFRMNPEHFIAEVSRLIKEQKATAMIERLCYDASEGRHEADVFTAAQTGQDFSNALGRLNKHVYDYCVTESGEERAFVRVLDTSAEVSVYAKLPRGFRIPTPVGEYNPDWAIAFEQGNVKHIYFVAETKGSLLSMQLRGVEKSKIDCAQKFFDELNKRLDADKVKYEVVTGYEKLMEIVAG